MKLTMFGATGQTGALLVRQALEEGHEVLVVARNPQNLTILHARLTVVLGELSDRQVLDRRIAGSDAVLSLLGPRKNAPDRPIARGTENILATMRHRGVRRFIGVGNAAVIDPNDVADRRFDYMARAIRFFRREEYEDVIETAEAIRESDRDWTVVRLPWLRNGRRTGRVRVGYVGRDDLGIRISRADAADFMLRQLDDDTFIHQMPMISGG